MFWEMRNNLLLKFISEKDQFFAGVGRGSRFARWFSRPGLLWLPVLLVTCTMASYEQQRILHLLPYLALESSDANSFGPKLRLLYLLDIGGRLGIKPRAFDRVDKYIATKLYLGFGWHSLTL